MRIFYGLTMGVLGYLFAAQVSAQIESNNEKLLATLSPEKTVEYFTNQLLEKREEWRQMQATNSQLFFEDMYQWGITWLNKKRMAAKIMGKKYYLQATEQQRSQFAEVLFRSLVENYGKAIFSVEIKKIEVTGGKSGKNKNYYTVIQNIQTDTNSITVEYLLYRKDDSQIWRIDNVFSQGVNFNSVLRNTFQRTITKYNDDIDAVIQNWSTAPISEDIKSQE